MFCENCGKENPDGAGFCNGCGSALNGAPVRQAAHGYQYQAEAAQRPAPMQKQTAKKKSKLPGILAGILAFALCFAASIMFTSKGSAPDVEPSSGAPSQAYSNLFWNYGPGTPESDFTGQGLKTVSYAIHYGEGMMENLEYVYEDGYVLAFVDSIYVPVYQLDDAARTEVNAMMEEELSIYTSFSFCQLSSKEDNGYYVYKLIFMDMDKKENVRQLSHTDMVTLPEGQSEVDRIGIKQTEDGLLASGYVKR